MTTRRRLTSPIRGALRALASFALISALAAGFVLVSGAIAANAAPPQPPAPPAPPANQPPTITSVSIGGQLKPGGQAQASAKTSGGKGPATFTFVWQVDGATVRTQSGGGANDNLSLKGVSYGSKVTVTVTPSAGQVTGTPATASVTLDDHPPTATVDLKPNGGNQLRPNGQATASAQTSDSDGDAVTLTYTWTVDGKQVRQVTGTKNQNDTYSWSNLSAGQVIAVSVVPNDGTMDGAAATDSGSIVETAPSATVSITGTLTPLGTATAQVKATDAEKDPVKLLYIWKINGKVVRQATTSAMSDNLPLSPYHYKDSVSVEVTPSDSWLTGATATDSDVLVDHAPTVKIQSVKQVTPPAAPAPAAAPTGPGGPPAPPAGPAPPAPKAPGANDPWRPAGSATVTASGSDPDRDPNLTYTYVWKVNGVAKQTHAGVTSTTDTFSWSCLQGGTVVAVIVTPNDGTMDGTPVTSSQTIVETPPTVTVKMGGDIRPGGLATAHADWQDADNDPVSLTYVWSVNGAIMQVDSGVTAHDDRYGIPPNIKPGSTVTVRVVANDGYFNGAVSEDSDSAGNVVAPAGLNTGYDPTTDPYSMYDTTLFTGAQAWWNAGYTGKGVTVAVIDTGVSQVPGLQAQNGNGNGRGDAKVFYGPDLSLDAQNPNLANLDSNGHGTFMAGLIAGHDSSLSAPYSSQPASVYRGMAPDATILSVKVGATDGEVDVTQVIAAIDWIVQHRHDGGMNVRVISLSYGTNSTQSYLQDPLAYAAEQAWKAGIVVVAAAGNTGFQQGAGAPGVADPAMDPLVIAAGGVDSMGTYSNGDDRLGDYSATAGCAPPACKGPDVLAYGSHVQGLRVPGSFIDLNHPEGRLGDLYFRGSGTSESTALTAGAIALILQRYPNMTPDDVKAFIQGGADKLPNFDSSVQGSGELDLFNLLDAQPTSGSSQSFDASTGTGTIEGSRGTDHLVANGITLQGEEDIFGAPIDSSSLATAEAQGSSWSGGTWNGNSWSGSSWSGNSWSGNTWSGKGWFGNSWSGNTWSGNTWSGNSWSGNSWSGNTWSGNTWSGNTWSGNTWSGNSWSGNSWSGSSWS